MYGNCSYKTNNHVKCKFCYVTFRYPNVSRMRVHLQNCEVCPPTTKQHLGDFLARNEPEAGSQVFKKYTKRNGSNKKSNANSLYHNDSLDNNLRSISFQHRRSAITTTPSSTLSTFEKQIQPKVSVVESTPDTTPSTFDKKILDKAFVKAIAVTGVPLSVLEHPLWKEALALLAPSYTPPTWKTASGLVDQVYVEMKNNLKNEIESKTCLHMQLDGWADSNMKGNIKFLISMPESVLVDFFQAPQNLHVSEVLTQKIMEVIEHNGGIEKYFVLIGDNTDNIQQALLNISHSYPHIIVLRWVAHTLNLLAKTFLDFEFVKPLLYQMGNIIKEIRSSETKSTWFDKIAQEQNCAKKLKLSSKTRWTSICEALEIMKASKNVLQILAVHEEVDISLKNKSTLLDIQYWTSVDEMATLIQPIAKNLKVLESDGCLMHKVLPIFADLEGQYRDIFATTDNLSDEEIQSFLAKLRQTKNEVIQPIHLAAHLLDPKECGLYLTSEEDILAMELICKLGQFLNIEQVVNELSDFRSRQGFWSSNFIWSSADKVSPLSWWKGICRCTQLSKIAEIIYTAPVSSAANKHSLSMIDGIHTKKRNSLLSQQADRIASISYNWTSQNRSFLSSYKISNESSQESGNESDEALGKEPEYLVEYLECLESEDKNDIDLKPYT